MISDGAREQWKWGDLNRRRVYFIALTLDSSYNLKAREFLTSIRQPKGAL